MHCVPWRSITDALLTLSAIPQWFGEGVTIASPSVLDGEVRPGFGYGLWCALIAFSLGGACSHPIHALHRGDQRCNF